MLGSTAVLPLGLPCHLPGPGSELPASVGLAQLEVDGPRGRSRLTHLTGVRLKATPRCREPGQWPDGAATPRGRRWCYEREKEFWWTAAGLSCDTHTCSVLRILSVALIGEVWVCRSLAVCASPRGLCPEGGIANLAQPAAQALPCPHDVANPSPVPGSRRRTDWRDVASQRPGEKYKACMGH